MVLFIGKEVPNNPPKLTVNLATLHARSHGCGCLCSSHSMKGIVTEYILVGVQHPQWTVMI